MKRLLRVSGTWKTNIDQRRVCVNVTLGSVLAIYCIWVQLFMTQECLDPLQWHIGLQTKTRNALNHTTFTKEDRHKRMCERLKNFTCTILLITWGSMLSGNLRILKSDSDTKAFSASKMLFSSTLTYTANVVNATWKKGVCIIFHTLFLQRQGQSIFLSLLF